MYPQEKNCGNTNSSHACTPTQLALRGFFNAIIQTDLKNELAIYKWFFRLIKTTWKDVDFMRRPVT